eukprot:TRINITY_DN13926_c0_g1_i1.p1 TRINITY_DN13926_c0_g1~~TRINITY_DN13926_c0_g1_i1.p1  ORF type:complete len:216 (-),score=35.61 TRINITY_DN13926_c0_g1_i1:24-671(-)
MGPSVPRTASDVKQHAQFYPVLGTYPNTSPSVTEADDASASPSAADLFRAKGRSILTSLQMADQSAESSPADTERTWATYLVSGPSVTEVDDASASPSALDLFRAKGRSFLTSSLQMADTRHFNKEHYIRKEAKLQLQLERKLLTKLCLRSQAKTRLAFELHQQLLEERQGVRNAKRQNSNENQANTMQGQKLLPEPMYVALGGDGLYSYQRISL